MDCALNLVPRTAYSRFARITRGKLVAHLLEQQKNSGKCRGGDLLQGHPGGLHRLAPERDLLADEGRKTCGARIGSGLAAGLLAVLDELGLLAGVPVTLT